MHTVDLYRMIRSGAASRAMPNRQDCRFAQGPLDSIHDLPAVIVREAFVGVGWAGDVAARAFEGATLRNSAACRPPIAPLAMVRSRRWSSGWVGAEPRWKRGRSPSNVLPRRPCVSMCAELCPSLRRPSSSATCRGSGSPWCGVRPLRSTRTRRQSPHGGTDRRRGREPPDRTRVRGSVWPASGTVSRSHRHRGGSRSFTQKRLRPCRSGAKQSPGCSSCETCAAPARPGTRPARSRTPRRATGWVARRAT